MTKKVACYAAVTVENILLYITVYYCITILLHYYISVLLYNCITYITAGMILEPLIRNTLLQLNVIQQNTQALFTQSFISYLM